MKSIVIVLIMGFVTGCAGLKTAEYRSAGEYNSPLKGPGPTVNSQAEPFTLAWPVERVQINRGYQLYKKRAHWGIDLGGQKGTPILASHQGRVIYAGNQFRGYGKMVLIEYNKKWATIYAHLNTINVKQGEWVLQGQRIGGMGRTGRATGVHLHFELMQDKQPVDPLVFLRIPQTVVDHWRDSSFMPSPLNEINQVHAYDIHSHSDTKSTN